MTYKIAVLASTRGTVLQSIIDALKSGQMPGVELVGVFSNKSCYAIERAQDASIPTFVFDSTGKTREEFDSEILKKLEELNVDLVVMLGYMRIVSPLFVEAYRGRIINVHPSLLPDFPGGMNKGVHEAVLNAGVKKTGCTVHLVDESIDGGAILLQKECEVGLNETVDTLKQKVQDLEKECVPEVIRQFAAKASS